jgi:uncharacterized membrane protein HdeD (DUF308 family)
MTPNPNVPTDPYPNKAVIAAVTTIIGVVVQLIATHHWNAEGETVTAFTGALTTLLVYVVSNHRKLVGR